MSWKRLLLMAVSLILLSGVGYVANWVYKGQRHLHELQRLDDWFTQAATRPPSGVDPTVWRMVCWDALHNSVWNCLDRPGFVATAKIRQLADYLDATHGRDLQSLSGAYGLMAYIEEMTPYAKDYSGFLATRLNIEDWYNLKPVPTPIHLPAK